MHNYCRALLVPILTLVAFAFSTATFAETCNTIADDAKRLACWDAAFPPQPLVPVSEPTSTEAVSTATKGNWVVDYDKSKIDDSTNVYSHLTSNERVPGRFGDQDYATLNVRCLENTTSAFFVFGGAFVASSEYDSYGDVTYRVDERKAVTRKFDESTDNHALGLWNGGASIPFIKQLFDGQKLVVRVTPYNESAIELTFDIAGAEEASKPVRKTCGW